MQRAMRRARWLLALAAAWAGGAAGHAGLAASVPADGAMLAAPPTSIELRFTEPVMAASVGRAMAYRAELAAQMNDPASAALWASRVLTVWGHADPSLGVTLARMRRLAARQPLS